MARLADLIISLKANSAQFERKMKHAKKTSKGFAKSAQSDARKVKAAFAGIGGAIIGGKLVSDFVRINKEFQSLKASLNTVTGSQKAANAEFARLKRFASSTPYQLSEVVRGFIKMKALGLDPSSAALKSFGDTASAMGKSLNDMIEAVADAATGEFERLKEFGIKASSEGDRVKFTFQGVTHEVGKNAAEITGYLKSLGQAKFAGAMERQMDTLEGAISNLKDSYDNLFATMGENSGANDELIDSIKDLSDTISDPAFVQAMTNFATGLTQIAKAAGELSTSLNDDVSVTAKWAAAMSVGDISMAEWAFSSKDHARTRLMELEGRRDGTYGTGSVTIPAPPRPSASPAPVAAPVIAGSVAGDGDDGSHYMPGSMSGSFSLTNFQPDMATDFSLMNEEAKQLADNFSVAGVELKTFEVNTEAATAQLIPTLEEAAKKSEELSQFQIQAYRSMQSHAASFFEDALTGQLDSFEDYVDSFINSLNRMVAEYMAQMLLMKALGEDFGKGGGLGGFLGAGLSMLGGLFGGGAAGGSGSTGAAGLMSAPGMNWGGRAGGGATTAGRPIWTGEHGERELFIPQQSGVLVPESQMGGNSISVPITLDSDPGNRRKAELVAEVEAVVERWIRSAS